MTGRSYRQFTGGSRQGMEKFLGRLEAEIAELFWQAAEPMTVREALALVNRAHDPPLAYTTVMTIMARLVTKGLLARRLVGHTHEYRVAQSREEFLRRSSERIVGELVADFGDVAIASFVDAIERIDPERLRALRQYLGIKDNAR